MGISEKIEWLKRYEKIMHELDRLTQDYQQWVSISQKVTTSFSGMPSGGSEDRIPNAVEKMVEIQNKISGKIEELSKVQAEIKKAIEQIKDEHVKQVMYMRYIACEKWGLIVKKVNYSRTRVHYLHNIGVESLQIEKCEQK